MNRIMLFMSLAGILAFGCFVKAQTNVSKLRLEAKPQVKSALVPYGDGQDGNLAAVANTAVSPEAAPLVRKMRVSFKFTALGRKALTHSDFVGAEQDFRQALAVYPRNNEAKVGLAQVLECEGRSDEASTAYHDAFAGENALSSYSTFPNDIAALARHGIVSEEAGEHQEAVKSYNMARQWLNKNPLVPLNDSFDPIGSPTPRLRAMLEVMRGVALVEAKDQDGHDRSAEALQAFQAAAQKQPNGSCVQLYLGYGLRKAGRFAEARQHSRRRRRWTRRGR